MPFVTLIIVRHLVELHFPPQISLKDCERARLLRHSALTRHSLAPRSHHTRVVGLRRSLVTFFLSVCSPTPGGQVSSSYARALPPTRSGRPVDVRATAQWTPTSRSWTSTQTLKKSAKRKGTPAAAIQLPPRQLMGLALPTAQSGRPPPTRGRHLRHSRSPPPTRGRERLQNFKLLSWAYGAAFVTH